MTTGCIYRIYNTVNGKSYIGQTIQNPIRRINAHFNKLDSPLLANAIRKHGQHAFQQEILEAHIPAHCLNQREIYWITSFNTVAPNGYNLTYGGGGAGSPSEETRRKLSEATKGANNPNYGKTPSREYRHKMSEAIKGKTHSLESRKKMSEARKGSKHSPETCRKISASKTGKPRSPETRLKIAKSKKGVAVSESTRRKISQANKGCNNGNYGKPRSAETRRKISESLKVRNKSNVS